MHVTFDVLIVILHTCVAPIIASHGGRYTCTCVIHGHVYTARGINAVCMRLTSLTHLIPASSFDHQMSRPSQQTRAHQEAPWDHDGTESEGSSAEAVQGGLF